MEIRIRLVGRFANDRYVEEINYINGIATGDVNHIQVDKWLERFKTYYKVNFSMVYELISTDIHGWTIVLKMNNKNHFDRVFKYKINDKIEYELEELGKIKRRNRLDIFIRKSFK